MTQLFIDGQEVVLSDDFSCKSISENPIFTKSGNYTLDITLSLDNPINSKLYKHINRINSLSRFENRTAILISDNEVIIKGKEVLLEFSNTTVDIQIVAGNSSLNYLIGNNLNLRDLDLGEVTIDKTQIVSNLKKDYPQVDYQLLPFYDPNNKFVGNRYTFAYDSANNWVLKYAHDGSTVTTLFLKEDETQFYEYFEYMPLMRFRMSYENYRPQPYLGAIIKRLFEALGYQLTNAIDEHPIYKYAYIVQANNTLEFAKMLPSWTVSKFLEEIEALFDCTVVVDNNEMSADIIFNHNYYVDATEKSLVMIDDFDVSVNESDEKMQYEKNIKYNLPESVYYKYQNLGEDLIKSLNVITSITATDEENIDAITQCIKKKTPAIVKAGLRSIYKSISLEFIEFIEDDKVVAKSVNDYAPLKKHDSDQFDEQLDIIPAEFFTVPWNMFDFNSGNKLFYMSWQIPIAKSATTPLISEGDNLELPLIQDIIESSQGSEKKEEASSQQISLAFYKSKYNLVYDDGLPQLASNTSMPFSFVRSISERVKYSDSMYHYFDKYNGKYVNPLSLAFLDGEIYSKSDRIDRSTIYKIRFLKSATNIDPRDIFIINNRKFYCKKFERTITVDGFDDIIEGEFYAEKD